MIADILGMNLLMGEVSSTAPSIVKIHSWLLANDAEYKAAINKTRLDRHKLFDNNMNTYISEVVKETHGGEELHAMGIMSAGLNPLTSTPTDFLPSPENDAVVVVFTERNILLMGTRAAHGFYWNNIVYVLEMEPDINIIQVGEAFQLLIGDTSFTTIFRKILALLNSKGLGALEFVPKV